MPMAALALAVACTVGARADMDSARDTEALRRALLLGPGVEPGMRWMSIARSMTAMDTMPGVEAFFGGTRRDDGFSWTTPRPGRVGAPEDTGMFASPLSFAVDPVRNGLFALRDFGVRTDLYSASTFSAASDRLPGTRGTLGSNRFNARVDWLLFRNPGEGHGRVTAQVRQNNVWPGDRGDLSRATGSTMPLNALVSGRDTFIGRLFYAQGFLDDRLIVSAGKINANDFVALNIYASDEVTQFLALPFDGNGVLPPAFQGYTEGFAVQALPTDWLYLAGVWTSGSGLDVPTVDFSLDRGYAVSAEASVLFEWLGMPGRVGLTWCGTNASLEVLEDPTLPEVWGNAWFLCAQYAVSDDVGVWAQAAWGEADVALLNEREIAVGVTVDDPFGRRGDGCGLAVGLAKPLPGASAGEPLRDGVLVEAYYRLQLTGLSALSIDAQMLAPSTSRGVDDPTVVGTLRWVMRF